jgi:zinc transporter
MTTTDLADVAPATGIIWAYRFGADGKASPIPNSEVDAALAAPGAG